MTCVKVRRGAWRRLALAAPLLIACVAIPAVKAAPRAGQGDRPVVDRTLAAFVARVDDYAALRDKVEASLPPFEATKDPVKLTERQRALAAALIAARPDAAPGDLFAAESRPAIARIVRADFAKRSRADRRALVQDLPQGAVVAVNAEYPAQLPLVTVPPGLLRALPPLPDDLEYRIVGRDLILLDTRAGLVLDVLPGVVPA